MPPSGKHRQQKVIVIAGQENGAGEFALQVQQQLDRARDIRPAVNVIAYEHQSVVMRRLHQVQQPAELVPVSVDVAYRQ